MDPVLILEVRNPETVRQYALTGLPVSLGRGTDNAIVLLDVPVSRHHARIEWLDSLPYITDLGSANGTAINGATVTANEPLRLSPGDTIQIVSFQLTLRERADGQAGRSDSAGHPLPDQRPALLTRLDPPSVTLAVNTQSWAKEYPVEGDTVTIGRDPDSDIPIDEPVVSWHHARLERIGGAYQVVDLGSSNGLVCQDAAVARLLLADCDLLWITDDVSLTFKLSPPGASVPAAEMAARIDTSRDEAFAAPPEAALAAQDAAHHAGMRAEASALEAAAAQAVAHAAPLNATMVGLETPQEGLRRVDLRQRAELTIGRSPDNDLHLNYPTVSRYHAVIRRAGTGEAYVIEDLGSSNGTLVNDEVVELGKPFTLHPGSTLRIGPIKLIFAPEAVQLVDESRDLRLDALHLNQHVGKGINLLRDISLAILPCEFVALVGVSGAGKSTLMNALAGFWPASDGTVMVNATDLYRHFDAFRTDMGYVPQDDIIHKELSAEKALNYVARLRLPSDMSAGERQKAVTQELETLGLIERKDVKVGSLSGGQRKRVSIGVERLTRPGLFFLDEATSGLDPGTENRLMRLLRQLADDGQTIVLITHATKNVVLCDQVIFLAKGGRLAYFGPPDEALAYFGVADFDEIYEQLEDERSPEEWEARYRQSAQYNHYVVTRLREAYGDLLDRGPETGDSQQRGKERKGGPAPTRTKVKQPSSFRQFMVLTARNLDIFRTDRVFMFLMLMIGPVLGLIDLIAWPRAVYDAVAGDASMAMVMLFMSVIIPFLAGAFSSVREIVKEKAIYRRERAVNLRVIPYLLSKVAVGLLFAIYTAAALLILRLVAVDLSHLELADLALYFLVIVLSVLSGVMWGLLISAVAPREEQAMLLLIVVVVAQMVFSGGFMSLNQLGPPGEVLGAVTSSKWSYEAVVDVTQVVRGECDGPSLEECELPGIQAYDTDPERQVVITHLEDRYGTVLEGNAALSVAALLALMAGLFIVIAVIQKRKDVI